MKERHEIPHGRGPVSASDSPTSRFKASDSSSEWKLGRVMDSVSLTVAFRRLFSHQICSRLRYHLPGRGVILNAPQRRWYRSPQEDTSPDDFDARRESDWQQRTDFFPPDKIKEFEKYPMVTSNQLKNRRERPKRVKMLARDFVEGEFPPLQYDYRVVNTTKTVSTIPITDTSPKMSPSFLRGLLLISMRFLTKKLFTPT